MTDNELAFYRRLLADFDDQQSKFGLHQSVIGVSTGTYYLRALNGKCSGCGKERAFEFPNHYVSTIWYDCEICNSKGFYKSMRMHLN